MAIERHALGCLRTERLPRPDVGRYVGAAEAVDRLLGVAHEEERARAERERCRVVGVAIGRRLAAEAPEDFCLERVGVLELVDKDVAEALGQRPAHLVMIAQQVAGGEDQIVEVQ